MADMLVKLYDLPKTNALTKALDNGVTIRRALAPEKAALSTWINANFNSGWVSEAEVAITRQPVSVLLATKNNKIIGFACYDAICRGFFGPTGVAKNIRKQGIGEALLFATLKAMYDFGYAYAIIGDAGPTEFYKTKVNASVIADSYPSIYKDIVI